MTREEAYAKKREMIALCHSTDCRKINVDCGNCVFDSLMDYLEWERTDRLSIRKDAL